MREVVAVCRSSGAARMRTARVLDRYLWRIGDRTWRGPASNACLERISKDLKAHASRSTAVAIHGFARSEDALLLRVGSRRRFGETGLAPVAVAGSRGGEMPSLSPALATARACLRISAMLHDLGKATVLFQDKLRRSIAGTRMPADALRHELFSALAWDALAGKLDDEAIIELGRGLEVADIDAAMSAAAQQGRALHAACKDGRDAEMDLDFMARGGLTAAIGLLILGHHRLPGSTILMDRFTAGRHVAHDSPLIDGSLDVAPGTPYWHEAGWIERLRTEFTQCTPGEASLLSLDLFARTALMFSDHLGSSAKTAGDGIGHLANSNTDGGVCVAADSLSRHVERVTSAVRGSFHALYQARDDYPSLSRDEVPAAILHPSPAAPERFMWQGRAAAAAASLASSGEGGFFACIIAGTGTGKTRAAPVILSAASFSDTRPGRRSLRYTLALGLRVLATQSGKEYVRDLGFTDRDVSVLVGQAPITFDARREDPDSTLEASGSEERLAGLDGVEIRSATGHVPEEGSPEERDWLIGLSHDPDRQVPAFIQMMAGADKKGRGSKLRMLAETPILCATIDHVIGAASPVRSRHLAAALRTITSDLVLDEIDQFSSEDLAVVARLVNLAGTAGRRVMIMSATVTSHAAGVLADAYRAGWSVHARLFGLRDHVHMLCTSDAVDGRACATSVGGASFADLYDQVRRATVETLQAAPPLRISEIIPVDRAADLPAAISAACSLMHDRHASVIGDFRVSMGFVRMTRVSHTAEMAAALPQVPGRLRLKICLHSRFLRLHRAWIEDQLKAALTRKGPDPDAGLRRLCQKQGVFDRARAAAIRDIEIILICSPVIETGNDLDFDYAVLDPVSLRAVVQAGGRVNRHRARPMTLPNIAILQMPVVCWERDGLLQMPGVETAMPGKLGLASIRIADFGATDHSVSSLLGPRITGTIDARLILEEEMAPPLLRAERAHLEAFLTGRAGLDRWMGSPLARHSEKVSRDRQFRRSTGREVLFHLAGRESGDLAWNVDRMPGRPDPVTEPARMLEVEPEPAGFLFDGLADAAMRDRFGDEPPRSWRMKSEMQIGWPVYDLDGDVGHVVHSMSLGLRRASSRGSFQEVEDNPV